MGKFVVEFATFITAEDRGKALELAEQMFKNSQGHVVQITANRIADWHQLSRQEQKEVITDHAERALELLK